jgi:hypothetical protein
MMMTTILRMQGGRFLINPTDGVKPIFLRITLSKGRAIEEAMTHSTLTKGQFPPTKSEPTMMRMTMII